MAVEYLCTISFLIPERLTPGKNIAFLQSASGIITSPAVLSMSITILFAILTPFTNGSCSNAEPANASGSISSLKSTLIPSVILVLSHPENAPFLIASTPSVSIASPGFLQNVFSNILEMLKPVWIRQLPVLNREFSDSTHFTFGNRLFGIMISNTLLLIISFSTFGKLFLLSFISRSHQISTSLSRLSTSISTASVSPKPFATLR